MRLPLASVLLLVGVTSGIARAERDEAGATRASTEAEALAKRGAFIDAASRYREAFRLDPQPKYLCNVGVAYQRAKLLPKAHLYLGECVRRGTSLDQAFMDRVRTTVVSVEDALRSSGFVAVDFVLSPEGASLALETFERDELFVGSRTLWMTAGSHRATVAAEGYVTRELPVEATPDTRQVVVTLERTPAVPPPDPVGSPPPVSPPPPPPRSLVPPLAVSAGALVLGGLALGFELGARSSYDDSVTEADDMHQRELYDRANVRRHIAQGFAVGAVACAGVAVYLFVRRGHEERVVVPTASADGGGVSFVGRW